MINIEGLNEGNTDSRDRKSADSSTNRREDHQGVGADLSPGNRHKEEGAGRHSERYTEVSLSHASQVFQYLFGTYTFSKIQD